MSEWKDKSSYSRGERAATVPSIWELDLDGLRVSVHRLHGCGDDLWFGSCYTMGVERKQLDAADIDLAQREFVAYLRDRAKRWAEKLGKAVQS